MNETLVLRLPENARPAAWMIVDASGNRVGEIQTGELPGAGALARGRRVRVCVPADEVVLLHADVPTRSTSKVMQAIPFAVEDQLAEDVDTLHLAVGERTAHGYLVAAVARSRMHQWLQDLSAVGIVADELLPEVLTIPMRAHALVLATDGARTLARFPDGMGIAASDDLLPLLVHQHLAQLPAAEQCTSALIYHPGDEIPEPLRVLMRSLNLEAELQTLPSGAIGLMGAARLPAQVIDLLQGEFGRSTGSREYWRRWRVAALLLAGLIAVLVAQQIVSEVRLQRESAQLQAEVTTLFHQGLPDVTRMVDPRAQMQQRLDNIAGGPTSATGLLPMLTAAGKGLQSQPTVQLQGLSFHNGVLQLQVQTSSTSALDALKSALQQTSSVHANLDSVSSNAGQTTGRLTISGAGT